MKEGNYPKSTSQLTEIWKGRYDGEVVALKVLRGPGGDHCTWEAYEVSILCDSQSGELLVVVLTDEIAVL